VPAAPPSSDLRTLCTKAHELAFRTHKQPLSAGVCWVLGERAARGPASARTAAAGGTGGADDRLIQQRSCSPRPPHTMHRPATRSGGDDAAAARKPPTRPATRGGDAAAAARNLPKKLSLSELENAGTSTMLSNNLFLTAGLVLSRPFLSAVAPSFPPPCCSPPAPGV